LRGKRRTVGQEEAREDIGEKTKLGTEGVKVQSVVAITITLTKPFRIKREVNE